MDRTINRIRGAVTLLGPDHITPMGVRVLDRILDEEETMKNVRIQTATHVEDLDVDTLPVGTRIATNTNKVLELEQIETPAYPEPFPKRTGFGPMDADEEKEWRKDKAKWEKANPPRPDAGSRYWIEPGTLTPYSRPLAGWLPAFILPAPELSSE